MNLQEAAADLEHFMQKRDYICQSSVEKGLAIADIWNIPTERRVRRKRKQPGEQATDARLSLKEEIDRVIVRPQTD